MSLTYLLRVKLQLRPIQERHENRLSMSFHLVSHFGLVMSLTTFQYSDSLFASSVRLPFACFTSSLIWFVVLFLSDLYFFNAIHFSPEVDFSSLLALSLSFIRPMPAFVQLEYNQYLWFCSHVLVQWTKKYCSPLQFYYHFFLSLALTVSLLIFTTL